MSESHSDALVFFGATGDLAYKKSKDMQCNVESHEHGSVTLSFALPD